MNLKAAFQHEGYRLTEGAQGDLFSLQTISLEQVKNSEACFTLILEADAPFLLAIGNQPAYSLWPDMDIIRLDAKCGGFPVRIHPVGMVKDDDGTRKADILLDKDHLYVDSGKTLQVFFRILISREATSGHHTGTIGLHGRKALGDEETLSLMPFSLVIRDVVLPHPEKWRFHLDLWQHLSNIARKHETPLFSDAHFEVAGRYVESLALLGQKAVTVVVTDIPWSGQRTYRNPEKPTDLFEYSMVRTQKGENGYVFDYTAMDRYIDLCASHGIGEEIEVFGLTGIWQDPDMGYGNPSDFPDGLRVRYLDMKTGTYRYMRKKEDILIFIRSLHDHFLRLGLMDKVRVIADEPSDIGLYRETLRQVKKAGPLFRFKTAINHAEFTREFKEDISDLVPSLECLTNKRDISLIREMAEDPRKRISWYVCCTPPAPNTFLRSPLYESRFICLYTLFMGLKGFLRWNYTAWPENPRDDLSFRFPDWSAGDMNFVYPSCNGTPLLSLRYMALKRGIEDYVLIQAAIRIKPCLLNEIQRLIMGKHLPEDLDPLQPSYAMDDATYDQARAKAVDILENMDGGFTF
ncbi:MAG: DUF4091 domain-containing protein [Clostridia bacterium]